MAAREDIDGTILVDTLIPPYWECPHCGATNETDEYANDILMEHLRVLRHCKDCGYVHYWKLKLTDGFKQRVVELLMKDQ